jgi:hypothetical protein
MKVHEAVEKLGWLPQDDELEVEITAADGSRVTVEVVDISTDGEGHSVIYHGAEVD